MNAQVHSFQNLLSLLFRRKDRPLMTATITKVSGCCTVIHTYQSRETQEFPIWALKAVLATIMEKFPEDWRQSHVQLEKLARNNQAQCEGSKRRNARRSRAQHGEAGNEHN